MVTDQMYMPPAVSQAETLGYPISKIDTDKLDDQTVYEPGTNIANQMANMQMTTGYPGKDMSAATNCLLYTSPSPRDQRGSRIAGYA